MKLKGTRSENFSEIKGRETTRDERVKVIALRDCTKPQMSWTAIGKELGIDRRACQKIYRRAKITGTPSNRKRTGRPPFFNKEEKERLRQFVTRDRYTRRLSWAEIRDEMGYCCSPDLVRKAMASLGYHKRVPRQKFKVRPDNRPKRVKWCQEKLHWTYEEWFRTLFSDESFYSTVGFHHRRLVIRNTSEEDHPDCIDDRERSGRAGVMVWGAFCGTIKSDLVFVPRKVSIDSATYTVHILDAQLIPFWHKACEAYGWTKVVEDGASDHKGHAKFCREKNEVDCMPWPAQSPDLNLIEAIWAWMECELGETWGRIEDLDTMQVALKCVWDSIPESFLEGLIRSMPDRLQAVIDAEGGATRY